MQKRKLVAKKLQVKGAAFILTPILSLRRSRFQLSYWEHAYPGLTLGRRSKLIPPHGMRGFFCCVTIFRKDFNFGRKPLMCQDEVNIMDILNVSFFFLICPRKKVEAKNFYSNMTQQHGTYDVSRKHSNQLLPNFVEIGRC